MNTEIIIISSIVFLAAFSIVLGIINWIYLSSTSSKLSALEGEIEKKAKEFDAIKKEKSQQQTSINAGWPAENHGRPSSFTGQENPAIEIVRNVRAEFRPVYSPVAQETQAPRSPQIDQGSLSGAKGPSADVLDVVDDAQHPRLKGNEIEIILFSQSKKDTDFPAAWKKITEYLFVTPAAHVKINFNNVMFLYEKELQYLEKILDVVSREQGRTTFINCHPELRPIISSRQSLAQCIIDR